MPRGGGVREGLCPLPPMKIFDDLILKWHILTHISGIRTYLAYFKFCCPRGRGVCGGRGCAHSQKIFDYY